MKKYSKSFVRIRSRVRFHGRRRSWISVGKTRGSVEKSCRPVREYPGSLYRARQINGPGFALIVHSGSVWSRSIAVRETMHTEQIAIK